MARTEERQGAVMDPQTALGFLAQASGVLAASLDYEHTLSEVARLAVPDLADWCAIDIVEPDGTTRQVTSVHPDSEAEALLLELRRRYRAEKQGAEGTARVIATGEPELARDVTGQVAIELEEGEIEIYRRMGPRSYMIARSVRSPSCLCERAATTTGATSTSPSTSEGGSHSRLTTRVSTRRRNARAGCSTRCLPPRRSASGTSTRSSAAFA